MPPPRLVLSPGVRERLGTSAAQAGQAVTALLQPSQMAFWEAPPRPRAFQRQPRH